jgi:hypothetical protein
MESSELRIIYEGRHLVSKLIRLGGSGILFVDINNRIEIYEVGVDDSDRKLLLTIYEVGNTAGYSLKVIKSRACQLENTYIKTMVQTLLPMVTSPGSKMELAEDSN